MLPGPQQGLLHQVLGLVPVPHVARDEAEQDRVVLGVERGHQLLVGTPPSLHRRARSLLSGADFRATWLYTVAAPDGSTGDGCELNENRKMPGPPSPGTGHRHRRPRVSASSSRHAGRLAVFGRTPRAAVAERPIAGPDSPCRPAASRSRSIAIRWPCTCWRRPAIDAGRCVSRVMVPIRAASAVVGGLHRCPSRCTGSRLDEATSPNHWTRPDWVNLPPQRLAGEVADPLRVVRDPPGAVEELDAELLGRARRQRVARATTVLLYCTKPQAL